ncbi:penicillin-binding protein activator [Bacterioplanoides pacificum]|uniref:Penicillin-binding protein activator n=1 Tax=Bacterioplanoides pacificum TaxID=1171596 RepID=A0ABV7VWJ9_9GAMM
MRGNSSVNWLRRLNILLVCGCIGLSGCSTTTSRPESGLASSGNQSSQQLLTSVATNLKDGEFRNAGLQLQLLAERDLDDGQQMQYLLLMAQLRLAQNEGEIAQEYLQQFQQQQHLASVQQELQYSLLKVRVLEAQQQFLAAARERDFLAAILEPQQQAINHEQIWQDLMELPETELLSRAEKSPDTQFGRWLQLAAIGKNSRLTLDEHLAAVTQWRNNNPGHPAAVTPPGGLAILADIAASRPQHIALMLPLSGPLGKTGGAIRDGFMAAYYDALNKGSDTPRINVYDSQRFQQVDDVYAAAQLDGVEWMIGPFDKLTVQALQQRPSLPLPTLALNYGERPSAQQSLAQQLEQPIANNLYQYGLAPEDEAVQIAEQAWADGHRRALVMMPKGNWGERIYAAFEQHWRQLGGEIGELRYYSNRKDYNPEIKALLNVDDSQQRFKTMRQLMREPTEFEPRRRQDADWVFMVALPKQARQIKPTLAFNFAGDLPVYATSHVFSGTINRRKDRDLNGIRFCDVPWLLNPDELHHRIDNTLKNGQGGYARLYAMGVDAFRLLPRLKQLEAFPNSQVFGATGALTLDNQRRIHRKTQCTRFSNGQPRQLAHH